MRSQQAIGRDEELDLLNATISLPRDAPPRWVYFIGLGGIGKTHLLWNLREQINEQFQSGADRATICAFVDLQSPDVLLVDGLIDAIVDELRLFVGDDPFNDLELKQIELMITQRDQGSSQQITAIEGEVREAFFDCFKSLAKRYRIVLLVDTVEELERRELLESDWSARAREVWAFMEDILALHGTFILAGRNQDPVVDAPDEQVEYHWHQPPQQGGLAVPETADNPVLRREIGPLAREEDARQIIESVAGTADPVFPVLVSKIKRFIGLNPIFLVLAGEHHRHFGALDPDAFNSSEALEEALVHGYFEVAGSVDVLLYMALGSFHFDVRMIQATTRENYNRSLGKYKGLEKLRFVKKHIDGTLSLHDEMRRLMLKYVWPVVDPDRKAEQPALQNIVKRYMEKQDEIQRQIAQKIADLQGIRPPQPDDDLALTIGLTSMQRDAIQNWIEQRRQELQERILVYDMHRIVARLSELNPRMNIGLHVSVFERRWQLLRTQARNPAADRGKLLEQIVAEAEKAGLMTDPTFDPDAYTTIQYRLAQEKYYQEDFVGAAEGYADLLRALEHDLGDDPVWHVRILIRLGNNVLRQTVDMSDAGEFGEARNLQKAKDIFDEAWALCEKYKVNDYRSRVANARGWVSDLEWDLVSAQEWYRLARHYLNLQRADPRRKRMTTSDILINHGYSLREKNLLGALAMCEEAYRLRTQERRQSEVVRTLRTLSILHRLKGDSEYSVSLAEKALDLAEQIGRKGDMAMAYLQAGTTVWYQYTASAEKPHALLEQALHYLSNAYEGLKAHRHHFIFSTEFAHNCYMLSRALAEDDQTALAEQKLREGIDAARTVADHRRLINGWRDMLELRLRLQPDLTYDDLQAMPEFSSLPRLLEQKAHLQQSAGIFIGDIWRIGGHIAQRTATEAEGQTALFDTAITHYVDAFKAYARWSGYSTVIYPDRLDFMQQRFDDLLQQSADGNTHYLDIVEAWCDRFAQAWQTNAAEDLAERMPQVENLIELVRMKVDFRRQGLLPVTVQERVTYFKQQFDRALQQEDLSLASSLLDEVIDEVRASATPQHNDGDTVGEVLGETFVPDDLRLRQAELATTQRSHREAHQILTELYDGWLAQEQGGVEEPPLAVAARPLDPAHHEYGTQTLSPAEWARVLSGLGWTLVYSNLCSVATPELDGLGLMRQAVTLSEFDPMLNGRLRHRLARAYLREGVLDEAERLFVDVLASSEANGDKLLTVFCLNDLANTVVRQGDFLSAELYAEQSRQLALNLGDMRSVCRSLTTLGIVYRVWGNMVASRQTRAKEQHLQRSLEMLEAALAWAERAGYESWIPNIHQQIAYTYWYKGEMDSARDAINAVSGLTGELKQDELHHISGHLHWDEAIRQRANPKRARQLFQSAMQDFRASMEGARRQNRHRLVANNLAGLLEMRYLQEYYLGQPNPQLYRKLLEDPDYKALQALRQAGYDFNLYYGSVERVLGAAAQWANELDAALRHYEHGYDLIAQASGYSRYNITEALPFLEERFRELPVSMRRAWAHHLYSVWKAKPAISQKYPDILTFLDLQILRTELAQERGQA